MGYLKRIHSGLSTKLVPCSY